MKPPITVLIETLPKELLTDWDGRTDADSNIHIIASNYILDILFERENLLNTLKIIRSCVVADDIYQLADQAITFVEKNE